MPGFDIPLVLIAAKDDERMTADELRALLTACCTLDFQEHREAPPGAPTVAWERLAKMGYLDARGQPTH